MAVLNKDAKLFIVGQLACFDTLKQVQEAVKERFGLTLSFQQISNYDPSTVNGGRLSPELKEVFAKRRKLFLDDVESIPIANRAVRLRMLNRAAVAAEQANNKVLMANLVEQAAKETGGAYTNRLKHEHTGRDGGPLQQVTMSTEEFRKVARDVANEV
jgi:hypothetical protein